MVYIYNKCIHSHDQAENCFVVYCLEGMCIQLVNDWLGFKIDARTHLSYANIREIYDCMTRIIQKYQL